MAQAQERFDEFEFLYESDAAASFLVVRCKMQASAYQIKMLERNNIRNVIPVEVVNKEGINCFYYNITSMIPLSLFLKRRKFSRGDFLKFLLNMVSSVRNSTGYLLNASNFVFSPEYIYINPGSLEPALVYIPASSGDNGCGAMQSFISDLLLMHINAEGFDEGNMVQRLLAAVKSETFNLKTYMILVNELLYGREDKKNNGIQETMDTAAIQASVNSSINKKEKVKEENKNNGRKTAAFLTIPAVLLQFAMGGLIYISRDILANIGDNPTIAYAAVAMIVLAVDVVLFKIAVEANIINVRAKAGLNAEKTADDEIRVTGDTAAGAQGKQDPAAGRVNETGIGRLRKEAVKEPVKLFSGDPAVESGSVDSGGTVRAPEQPVSLKTELLGSHPKGVRILRSIDRQNGVGDIVIDRDDFIIGRLNGHVDYVLNNNAVGKLHAELINRDGICYVKDLNSMNGTYINNKRIESNKEFELKNNDRLQLANSEFIFIHA